MKTSAKKSNTGGSTSGSHATPPQSSTQKATNGSSSGSHDSLRDSHSANIGNIRSKSLNECKLVL